ncbi:hypothetical protein OB905_02605 [Halobacteria archaeon AArc-dxtr1]|nr:hypothetical protein [Halobacteria archaeon AArc-dxtr1]
MIPTRTLAAVAALALVLAAVSFGAATAMLSTGVTFEGNHVGAADEWGAVDVETTATESVLDVTVTNDGETTAVADYEIAVDGELHDAGTLNLGPDDEWTAQYAPGTVAANETDREWTVSVGAVTETETVPSEET